MKIFNNVVKFQFFQILARAFWGLYVTQPIIRGRCYYRVRCGASPVWSARPPGSREVSSGPEETPRCLPLPRSSPRPQSLPTGSTAAASCGPCPPPPWSASSPLPRNPPCCLVVAVETQNVSVHTDEVGAAGIDRSVWSLGHCVLGFECV